MAPKIKVQTTVEPASDPVASDAPTAVPAGQPTPVAPKPKAPKPKINVAPPARDESASAVANAEVSASAPKPKTTSTPKMNVGSATSVPAKAAPKASVEVPAASVEAPTAKSVPKTVPSSTPAPKPKVAAAPKASVKVAEPSPEAPQDAPAVTAQEAEEQRTRRLSDAREAATGWVHRTYPGHEHAFWGGVIALLVAVLGFIIGPLRLLLVIILVVVGVAIGQVLDGDPKIIRLVRGLFDNDRELR